MITGIQMQMWKPGVSLRNAMRVRHATLSVEDLRYRRLEVDRNTLRKQVAQLSQRLRGAEVERERLRRSEFLAKEESKKYRSAIEQLENEAVLLRSDIRQFGIKVLSLEEKIRNLESDGQRMEAELIASKAMLVESLRRKEADQRRAVEENQRLQQCLERERTRENEIRAQLQTEMARQVSPQAFCAENGRTIDGRWQIQKKLRSGGCATVFQARDLKNGFGTVAVKVEQKQVSKPCTLLQEYWGLQWLMDSATGNEFEHMEVKIPHVYYYGADANLRVMVMNRLGISVEQLWEGRGYRFSGTCVSRIGLRAVDLLQDIHQYGILHRDVKPSNLMTGLNDPSILHLIDFGFCTPFRDLETWEHVPREEGKAFVGTPLYAPISMHLGFTQSRRDDLESLGYMLAHLRAGTLPWSQTERPDMNLDEMAELKASVGLEELCMGVPELITYFRLVRRLEFSDDPNYVELKETFRAALLGTSNSFDWE